MFRDNRFEKKIFSSVEQWVESSFETLPEELVMTTAMKGGGSEENKTTSRRRSGRIKPFVFSFFTIVYLNDPHPNSL